MLPPASQPDEEGWTRVTGQTRQKRRGPPFEAPVGPSSNPQFTVQDLKEMREKARRAWAGQDARASLQGAIRTQMAHQPKKISSAVCLGIGTVEIRGGEVRAGYNTFTQLEAFLDVVGILEESQGEKIRIYFQEPQFSEAEKTHLQELGYAVLSDPEAFTIINHETFLYGPHLSFSPYLDGIAAGPPAVVMGNPIDFVIDDWPGGAFDATKRAIAVKFSKTSQKIPVPKYQDVIDGFIYWNGGQECCG